MDNLSKSEFNLLLANTRRPIIWNQESLKIAKKLNFENIKLGYNTNGIHPKLIEMFEKFDKVLKTDNFFAKKFSIKNISFWEIFQDDFVLFCKKRFSEILFFIDSLNKLLIKEDIKLLITLDDSQQIGRTATIFCNKKKIPSILSLNADINIFNDNKRKWEVFTLHKIYADKFAIYGELAKQLCLNHNIDSSKLVCAANLTVSNNISVPTGKTLNYSGVGNLVSVVSLAATATFRKSAGSGIIQGITLSAATSVLVIDAVTTVTTLTTNEGGSITLNDVLTVTNNISVPTTKTLTYSGNGDLTSNVLLVGKSILEKSTGNGNILGTLTFGASKSTLYISSNI